jgi:hypothetical protein
MGILCINTYTGSAESANKQPTTHDIEHVVRHYSSGISSEKVDITASLFVFTPTYSTYCKKQDKKLKVHKITLILLLVAVCSILSEYEVSHDRSVTQQTYGQTMKCESTHGLWSRERKPSHDQTTSALTPSHGQSLK